MEINIYSDESCHLENDNQPIMAFGCIWCPKDRINIISQSITELKNQYNAKGELKWNKVSKSKEIFYLNLIDWFMNEQGLNFRCLILINKNKLDHESYNKGSHDTFYYKMYYSLLNKILSPTNQFNIYLDIKDTRSSYSNKKLRGILCNNTYDFSKNMITKIQNIHSGESQIMQLTDFLLGAVTYKNRGLSANITKQNIIAKLENKLGGSLLQATPMSEKKFNLFFFEPK